MLNYVDFILLFIILAGVLHGYLRGFILGFLELFALAASIFLAFAVYQYIGVWLSSYFVISERWLLPLSFFIAIILARLFIGIAVYFGLKYLPKHYHHQQLNKYLGLIPGAIRGIFYASLLSLIFLFMELWPGLTKETRASYIANTLSQQIETLDTKIASNISEQVKKSISRLTLEPESDETVLLHFKVENPIPNEKMENHLLVLVNEERRKANLPPLARDTALRTVAREHSLDMFRKGYFSHISLDNTTPFDRIKAHNITYFTAGENLALAQTVEIAHMGLMNSPGHRANILNPKFGRVGIGIMDGGIYGIMVTQNFRD
ncbi:CvpA family protein [Pelobium manganitolerans]|uniref:CvpA family protein n=1 Tax=Pelobium manganitolerans TaxID=1842495 RepID=UPI003FA36944